MAHDIPALEEKLRKLGHGIDRLADAKHAEHLVPALRRPGRITVAEAIYAHGMLDHLQVRVDELARACDAFVAAVQELGASRTNGGSRKVLPAWSANQARARQAPADARALRFIL